MWKFALSGRMNRIRKTDGKHTDTGLKAEKNRQKRFCRKRNRPKMKDRLVIIGANDFQNQLICKAKDMGYETHVFAWQCGDVGEYTADHFYPISIVEKEQILEKCREIHPVGVVSIASDLANITVNYLSEHLGLIGNGIDSTELATNKHKMRRVFEAAGLPSPKSALVTCAEDVRKLDFQYPLIIKPTDRSGSRGIYKIESPDQLPDAIDRARSQSFEQGVLVEEFAEGNEYSVEYVSWEGEHHFLAITKKYTTGAPMFVETAHIQPAYDLSAEMEAEIKLLVPKILDALQVRFGASHTEIKIDRNGRIKIIEAGARMGGDCIGSDLVFLSTGCDYVKMVIDIACGKKPIFPDAMRERCAAVFFVFSEEDLERLKRVQEKYSSMIARVSMTESFDGREIGDSSARYGYYLLSAARTEDMMQVLQMMNLLP